MSQSFIRFKSREENPHYEGVYDISPDELNALKSQSAGSLKLIDVRLPEEYTGELGHIPGSELIVLDTIPDHMDQMPKDQTIVFICRSGARSARATAFLQAQGFQSVYNMKGGMIFWNELGLPTER